MAGLYIHVPYCKQKCSYCNFHFSVNLDSKEELVESIIKEIEIKSYFFKNINTLYIGGGTPSLFKKKELDKIVNKINDCFNLNSLKEFTIELNPEDVSDEILFFYKQLGINRLSVGVQSFFDKDLKILNRVHDSQKVKKVIGLIKKNGFDNVSIDLIYGIPKMSNSEWKKNLEFFFDTGFPHLSAYCLTVEKKTLLEYLVRNKKIQMPSEYDYVQQYEQLIELAAKKGFEHYEISNFSLPNYKSKHNCSYWTLDTPYLGIGPSAHSFSGNKRYKNVSNNFLYIDTLKSKKIDNEVECLDEKTLYNEYIIKSLRTLLGVDVNYVKNNFNSKIVDGFLFTLKKYKDSFYLKRENKRYIIKEKYWLISDGIISDFLYS